MSSEHRTQRVYDHRLRRFVFDTGDSSVAIDVGVPPSTARGWLRSAPRPVVSSDSADRDADELQREVQRLRRQVSVLLALHRLLLAIVRINGRLGRKRITDDASKAMLFRAIVHAREVFPLRSVLRVLGLSASRFHSWDREARGCHADTETTCTRVAPNRLTANETLAVKQMVTDPQFRHVPTGRLALLAQRLGRVFASSSTWYRLLREKGWRRPRHRVHPSKPKVGLKAKRPDEAWHVDVTIIRLLDGTKLYLHGVIDNFSRRILAWRLANRLRAETTAILLRDAMTASVSHEVPKVVVDGGSENFNGAVDELVTTGLLKRLLAQTDIRFSNSPIEAFWKSAKHQWFYLNTLDSAKTVEKLVSFYVQEHNSRLPHMAFKGQTPDEMYFGTGTTVPGDLAAARAEARVKRHEANRALICEGCPLVRPGPTESTAET